ncbi:hypothetical protein [Bradyrhizobium zhanjiangense]|uniref:hypothetical protein n=1 Tax=Bradyrhizobium zhanjiangense TaxID=1325107 RepID=UPI001009C963|nr:hypothetical protein [Bradyrhizobium zhanjiangense]
MTAISGAYTQGLLPDLEVCKMARPERLPIGEQLARAEDLRAAAKRYDSFDYDRCYKLGRSCYAEVESPMLTGVEDVSYRACRDLAAIEHGPVEVWQRLKRRHIECIVDDLNKRADAIADAALRHPSAESPSEPTAAMAQLSGKDRKLDGSMLKRLASGATWCSRSIFRVRALCADGSGALADGHGQQMLAWRILDDRICLVALGETPSCFSVQVSGSQLSLTNDNSERVDLVTVVPGVAEAWSQSCPSK